MIAPSRLPLRPRPLIAGGLLCVLAAAVVAALVPVVLGRPLPKVHVTWRAIDPGARQALEARFRLTEPHPVGGTTWSYVPLDRSAAAYRAIVTDPAVADTAGINRRTFAVARTPPLTERRGGLWPGAPAGTARLALAGSLGLGVIGLVALVTGVAVHRRASLRSAVGRARGGWPGARAALARATVPPVLVTIVVIVLAAAFRFLSLDYFENDHFTYVTFGYQSALGELPVRDYDDPGFPLGIALSAAAMRLGGTTLLPEAVLTIGMLAIAAGFAWRASLTASGLPALALFATALQVIAFPRLYSYPKILIGAAAPLAFFAYARRPTLASLFWLAGLTEFSLLLRHDLAVYVGVATGVFLLLQHDDRRMALRRLGLYAAMCAALTIPYALYLAAFGVEAHIASAVGFSQAEVRRTAQWGSLFTSGSAFAFALVLLPIGVLAALAWRRSRSGRWDEHAPAIAGSAVLLLLIDAGMMRDTTPARLSDVVGPAPVVFAWAGAMAVRWRHRVSGTPVRVVVTVALVLAGAAAGLGVSRQGQFPHQLQEGHITEGWRSLRNHAWRQVELLQAWPWIDLTQSAALEPVVRYLDRCTTPDQSVLVVGYMPQLTFLAQRPFAGGHAWILPGYFESESDQSRMARRLTAAPPAVVAIEPDEATDIAGHWPAIARRLETYSAPVAVGEFQIRTDLERQPRGTDEQTGLACFR